MRCQCRDDGRGSGPLLHRLKDEVDAVAFGYPLAQVARQEHRPLAVNVDETGGQEKQIPLAAGWFKTFSKIPHPQGRLATRASLAGRAVEDAADPDELRW